MSPYPSHPHPPPRHFLLAQPTLKAFNTPSHRHPRGRDARMQGSGLQAPSPPTLSSHGASAPPTPKCVRGAGIDTSKCPQNAHAEDPKARWAPLERTSTGSCPVGSPAHKGSVVLEDGEKGFIPFFHVSSPKESGSDPREHGAVGEGSSEIWREPLCYHHYCLSFGEGGKQ